MDDSDDKFEDADEEDYFANIASDARFDNKWRRNASIDQENSSEFQSGSNPCHDQASTMVMKNDDDDDEMDIGNNMQEETDHTSATANEVVFDEKKFFSAPTFPARVLEESKYMIYERIEEPLSRLESDDGPEVFLKHRQEHIHKADMDEEEERRLHQQNLDDLLVQGDPREYQRHLLEIALQKNTIVNLGTGTGKTLIALLCIKEIREADKDHKQTLFLVPSVALAIQHGLTLQSNLPNFRVESAYYERSGSQKAREKLVSCDIIVATHGAVSRSYSS
jgi:primosomal protein N'